MSTRNLLELQRCDQCGAWWALRPYACATCGSTSFSWQASSGQGVVVARSEVHRAPDAAWRALTPYVLVLVHLREQVTLMGHADTAVTLGQEVRARTAIINDRPLLKFEARHPP